MEDSRDRGLNIREKAQQITSLLLDDVRLKNERAQIILTRNKSKQNNPGPVGADARLQMALEESQKVGSDISPTRFPFQPHIV